MTRDRMDWRITSGERPTPRAAEGPVLVVEADAALRRVIALGLRGRGLDVVAARSLGDIWERVTAPPAAIVLDVGIGGTSEWVLLRALGGHHALRTAPLVLLAWESPAGLDSTPLEHSEQPGERVCLTKPFDARTLFAAVERLVAAPSPAIAMAAANTRQDMWESAPAGARTPKVAGASAWPLVAAGATTLAVAGFLIQPVLSVVGIVLLIAAVLWWSTTNTPAEPQHL